MVTPERPYPNLAAEEVMMCGANKGRRSLVCTRGESDVGDYCQVTHYCVVAGEGVYHLVLFPQLDGFVGGACVCD
jgi:hypothetical protein